MAARRQPVSSQQLDQMKSELAACVTIAYPMGLPEYDTITQLLAGDQSADSSMRDGEQSLPIDSNSSSSSSLSPSESGSGVSLWFAGKKMESSQPLSKYIGTNEKCFVRVKLQAPGSSAPGPTPSVDEETQRRLMALYHKKQREEEEERRRELEAQRAEGDTLENSAWVSGSSLRSQLHGIRNIRMHL